jgi:hypothetical protein
MCTRFTPSTLSNIGICNVSHTINLLTQNNGISLNKVHKYSGALLTIQKRMAKTENTSLLISCTLFDEEQQVCNEVITDTRVFTCNQHSLSAIVTLLPHTSYTCLYYMVSTHVLLSCYHLQHRDYPSFCVYILHSSHSVMS